MVAAVARTMRAQQKNIRSLSSPTGWPRVGQTTLSTVASWLVEATSWQLWSTETAVRQGQQSCLRTARGEMSFMLPRRNSRVSLRFHSQMYSYEMLTILWGRRDGVSPIDTASLKQDQRDLRQAEIEEMVQVLREINDGSGEAVSSANQRGEGRTLGAWKGRLDMDLLVLGGHSYGATGAVSLGRPVLRRATAPSFTNKSADRSQCSSKLLQTRHVRNFPSRVLFCLIRMSL